MLAARSQPARMSFKPAMASSTSGTSRCSQRRLAAALAAMPKRGWQISWAMEALNSAIFRTWRV
jgi:hypothetical protein